MKDSRVWSQWVLAASVILVLFGPDRLPEIAKKIGGATREIRENLDSMNEQMNSALETSMQMDQAQMSKPAEPQLVDSTAQVIEPPQIESIAPTQAQESSAQPIEATQTESIAPPENPDAPSAPQT